MTNVLENVAGMLTEDQLSFMKTPSGKLQFDSKEVYADGGRLKKRAFFAREEYDPSATAVSAGDRAHRTTEEELLRSAMRMALPEKAYALPTIHHYGRNEEEAVAQQQRAMRDARCVSGSLLVRRNR